MENIKLLSISEINNLSFKSEKELKQAQGIEIQKMHKMLEELHKTLQITSFISISSFLNKYKASSYINTLKNKGLIKNLGSNSIPEWQWDSPKEPDTQTAAAVLKSGGCPLFKKKITQQIISAEIWDDHSIEKEIDLTEKLLEDVYDKKFEEILHDFRQYEIKIFTTLLSYEEVPLAPGYVDQIIKESQDLTYRFLTDSRTYVTHKIAEKENSNQK